MRHEERLLATLRQHATGLAQDRVARQRRCKLDPADFDALRDIGLHRAAVPVEYGGWWECQAQSLRTLCEAHRILATGDASLALAASMHTAVLSHWRDPAPPASGVEAWEAQKRTVFSAAAEGAWFGTVISEPGSGGDIGATRATARRDGMGYWLTGQKHFGTGSGATSYVLTAAVPEGESEPQFFYLDVRGVPWDGSRGMRLIAEWDGHGMTATNSHAFAFQDFPATRLAWPGSWRTLNTAVGGGAGIASTSVVVGVVDAAMSYTRDCLRRRGAPESLGAFEQTEWAAAFREAWLLEQAWDAALQAFEGRGQGCQAAALAKANIALLAESVMTRLCRIAGGGSYSRHSPLGFWLEDVRACGFLRPAWGVAAERIFALSWEDEPIGFV
jgi:alkylation response protein AidB-like acyl-CoA dehydrogenase